MFEIEMLPAREGDCLWIRYGKARPPKQILIDGGRAATYKELKKRLVDLPANHRHFELFVITHVDRDHIEGAVSLLEDKKLPITFSDIWFNGFDHLKSAKLETFGAVQGERLSMALLKSKAKWNSAWKSKAVAVRKGSLPKITLTGNLTLTLLSPDQQKLLDLIPTWVKECKDAGLIPGTKARIKDLKGLEHFGGINIDQLADAPFAKDTTKPNGSSIAFLAEYDGKRVLLGADAHVDCLLPSIRRLLKRKKRLSLDAFKIPHHGSEGNLSKELLDVLDCPKYLISTNGSYFKHPRAMAIARILKHGGTEKTLYFNYASKYTKLWTKDKWCSDYGYSVVLPNGTENGTLVVSL